MHSLMKRFAEPIFLTLFGRRIFHPLFRALYLVSLKGMGMNITFGNPTRAEQKFLNSLGSRVSNSTPVVFDVGANIGDFAAAVSEALPNAQFHLFEPNPKMLGELRKVARGLDAKVVEVAVCDRMGEVTLYDRTDTDIGVFASLSSDVVKVGNDQPIEAFESISAITLDHYAAENGVDFVDFLKIDVEGYELDVLRGASRLLAERRIGIIQFEFNYCNHIRRVMMADFREILSGFRLNRVLADGSLQPLEADPKFSELFTFQNIVALPESAIR